MASIDITEEVRRKLGSNPVPKIDPNTQAPLPEKEEPVSPDLGNAVIPAMLIAFYKHSRNEETAAELLNNSNSEKILDDVFGEEKNNIIQSVSIYTNVSTVNVETEMKKTSSAIIEVLRDHIKDINGKTICAFFTDQRSNILKHLPVELNLGEAIKDSSVDDRTNKMEGPMSGMMHSIEKIFSSTK